MAARKPAADPRVVLLWGQEDVRKREALARLLDDLVPLEDRELDVQYVDAGGSQVTGEMILAAAGDRGMFSERRVVVVINAGRLRSARHTRTQQVLARGLPHVPPFSTLILVAYADDSEDRRGRNPFDEELMGAIKKNGVIHRFNPLSPEELSQLAIAEAARMGKVVRPPVAAMLAQRCPDAQHLLQEVAKLCAYAGDAPEVDRAAIESLVPVLPDENIFKMIAAVMAGNRQDALSRLRALRAAGLAPQQILTMLGREVRMVTQARYLKDFGVHPRATAETIPAAVLEGLPEEGGILNLPDWQKDKLWREAARSPWPRLAAALESLVLAEAGMKGWERGIDDPNLALECFVHSAAS